MPSSPTALRNARLPRWLLPADWPIERGEPVLADVTLSDGGVRGVSPVQASVPQNHVSTDWNLQGRLVLPGFVDAHTHLDKAFTLRRVGPVQPGLLGAIEAMLQDRAHWTPQDVAERAARGLGWAWAAGTTHVRTHVDWWEPDAVPLAWSVLAELARAWQGRIRLEQVSLIKLPLFEDLTQARRLARAVAATGPHALLGAFVHSTNWSPQALRHLFVAAQACDLDVDLHVDEELNPQAQGLAATAHILKDIGFAGRVVCGHTCALAAQPEAQALATLDAVAGVPITLVSLPVTNLLLQDAVTGRTPRQRGLTLVKEARARGIPLLFASDNVQDPFCRVGSFDPVESFSAAVLAAQLDDPFDRWSNTLCRGDWLRRGAPVAPSLEGARTDLVIFTEADPHGWPSRAAARVVLRHGTLACGQVPATWHTPGDAPLR